MVPGTVQQQAGQNSPIDSSMENTRLQYTTCGLKQSSSGMPHHSNFFLRILFNAMGISEARARPVITIIPVHEMASPAVVRWYKVVPPCRNKFNNWWHDQNQNAD